jgi:APA family basic amino acid/polyamine antiporter
LIAIAVLLPGQTTFLGDMYAFGAMLSFTIAHAAVIALRYLRREREMRFRARPNISIGGVSWPLFAIFGGLGTVAAWIVVVVQKPAARWVGLGWILAGLIAYAVYRRYVVRAPLGETLRAPVLIGPAAALEYRSILVPVKPGAPESEEAVDFACRLAAERGSSIAAVSVVVVPLEFPLEAELPEDEARADEALDTAVAIGELYGVDVVPRLLRARSAGRAIVREAERRQSEIIVVGAPRWQRSRRLFSETVDYVLKHAPSRVMVAAGRRAA